MEKGLKVVLQFLKQMTIPCTSEKEIFNVCQISSNQDTVISQVVAKTMSTVGLDGVVNIVESPTGETKFDLVNGLIIERGFVSDTFVTENKI